MEMTSKGGLVIPITRYSLTVTPFTRNPHYSLTGTLFTRNLHYPLLVNSNPFTRYPHSSLLVISNTR
jgi:hypothetical protein